VVIKGPSEVRVTLNIRPIYGGGGVATQLSMKRVPITLPGLKAKRQKLDSSVKLQLLEAAAKHGPRHAIALAQNTKGYEHVDRHRLKKWKKQLMQVKRKPGRPGTDDKFNCALLEELVVLKYHGDSDGKLVVEANVAFSYHIIRQAAQRLQASLAFKDDPKISTLKFRNSWIRTWCRNVRMKRRRVTTTIKTLGSKTA
jgi:hypothetical protein